MGPSRIGTQRLDILHHEGSRIDALDNIKEVKDMRAARIVSLHLPDYREALTGRSTNHNVGLDSKWGRSRKNVVADNVIADVGAIALTCPPINLVGPDEIEASPGEAVVKPPGS